MSEKKEKKNNNKEKRDEIQKVNPRLNCNFTKLFIEKYFEGSLGYTIIDCILEHLLTCKKCYNEYRKYGASIGVSFNVREATIKFVSEQAKDNKICRSRDALLRLGFEKDLEVIHNKWSIAADKLDIGQLMNLRAFIDFTLDKIEIRADYIEEDAEAIHNYTKWFATKICKTIDFLEKCLSLEINDNSQTEGYNNDEKS